MTATTTTSASNIPPVDWAPAENQCNIFLNSDLFGGDLFGDELMDMYSSVSDDDPEVITSNTIITGEFNRLLFYYDFWGTVPLHWKPPFSSFILFSKPFIGEAVSMNTDSLETLDVLSSYNDIHLLLPSNPEPFSTSTSHNITTAAATNTTTTLALTTTALALTTTALALSVPAIPTDVGKDEGRNVAVMALSTKIPIIKKKAKASGGGARKRKIATTSGQVQHHTRCVSGLSTGSSVVEWVSSDSSGTTDLSNAVFGGSRYTNITTMAEPNKSGSKRTKFSSSVQVEGAKAAAASRKAALAAAVSQYAPLAASQVSKIRQNASILEKSNDRNEIVKSVLKVVNPLDRLTNSPSTILPKQQQQQMKRPTTPSSAAATGAPSGINSSPISPGGGKTRFPVPSSTAIPGVPSGGSIHSGVKPVISNIPDIKYSSTLAASGCATTETTLPATPHKAGENGSICKISTAHVNSLTSANWSNTEAATTAVPAPVNMATSSSSSNKGPHPAQGPKRRASLTVEDRAKQNRDRNREHARNTRLRKKAYVDELKKTLTEIVSQRDSLELEKIQNTELRNVRFSVIQEFLKLRCNSERDWTRWGTILDKNFVLRLPVTQYRKMNQPSNNTGTKMNQYYQEIKGIADVMNDAMTVSEMMLSFQVECEKSSFMMDGTSAMVCWTLRTAGSLSQVCIPPSCAFLVTFVWLELKTGRNPLIFFFLLNLNCYQGVSHELNVIGSLRASFDASTNKLTFMELFYDTNAFSQQLQSMYLMAFGGEATSGSSEEAADETAALLDSLNVPQYEGFLNETSHFIASESSSDEKDK
jgi:hypothetical protein